jgi:PAS domain S-box-containing protein
MSEMIATYLKLLAEIKQDQQVEKALGESEARLRMLVDNAADAILLIDLFNGQIVDVNQRACYNLGYSYEELLSLHASDIDIKFTLKEMVEFRQKLVVGVPTLLESVYRRQDGTTFPTEASICVLESGNQQLELAIVRDISTRKQAEQAMVRLAEIGELAAKIVHEIRNPLTTVLMGLSAFEKMELPERAQQRLALALDEAERLKRLLSEILVYAKHHTLQLSKLEVNHLIAQMIDSIRNIPATVGCRIELVSTLPTAWILGDRDKLQQVFINLVKNACEAAKEGEVITWLVVPGTTLNQVCINIHNGGDAIPPEVMAKLGTPFFTTKPSGNGLGLAIVKQIVEAHGGNLKISSAPEIGTTVSLILPLIQV